MSQICPQCNREWPNDFMACPLDGTTLVPKPQQQASVNLKLGDANAISGGVNISDSHDVYNNDNSIHNITNTSNIVNNYTQQAAQKTAHEEEIEVRAKFRNICERFIVNGLISQSAQIEIEKTRLELGLDEEVSTNIIEIVKRASLPQNKLPSSFELLTLNQIDKAIENNNIDFIKSQISTIFSFMESYPDNDDIQYTFSVIMAALYPERLIKYFETNARSSYWVTYWVFVAYLKIDNHEKAATIIHQLRLFKDYPENNIYLLSTIDYIRKVENMDAERFSLLPHGSFSRKLELLYCSLAYYLLGNESTNKIALFYYIHLVCFDSNSQRIEAEKKNIKYEIHVTGYENQMLAVMVLRNLFHFDNSTARYKLSNLPCLLFESRDYNTILDVKSKLISGQLFIKVFSINGLGEKNNLI